MNLGDMFAESGRSMEMSIPALPTYAHYTPVEYLSVLMYCFIGFSRVSSSHFSRMHLQLATILVLGENSTPFPEVFTM